MKPRTKKIWLILLTVSILLTLPIFFSVGLQMTNESGSGLLILIDIYQKIILYPLSLVVLIGLLVIVSRKSKLEPEEVKKWKTVLILIISNFIILISALAIWYWYISEVLNYG